MEILKENNKNLAFGKNLEIPIEQPFMRNYKNLFWIVFVGFFLFQLISFLGYIAPSLSSLFFWLTLVATFYLTIKKIDYGLLILCFEFLAGHEGHLFSFAGISLRLALFITVMVVWFFSKRQAIKPSLIFSIFIFFLFLGLINGFTNSNPLFALKDFINFSYIFLVFPLIDFLKDKQNHKDLFVISMALIFALAILTIFVLILFSTGLAQIHDIFYWWWRGTVIGKVTFAGNNFFRIVTPAHLLVLPLLLIYLRLWFTGDQKKKILVGVIILATSALLINFSRAYFLGLFIGLLFLSFGLPSKKWFKFTAVFLLIMLSELIIIFASVSGGKTFGLDFFVGRMKTTVAPEEELSSATRLAILPVLLEKIKEKPILGHGLGMTVSYQDPETKEIKNTRHLDWGYLETMAELGVFGFLSFLTLIFSLFYKIFKRIKEFDLNEKRVVIGLGAGLIALLVATATGPYIFHALGIFYLSLTMAYLEKKESSDNYQRILVKESI